MFKILITLITVLSTIAYAGAPVIGYPSGNDIKLLKSNIDLNGQAKILSGTVDPTVTATSAPIGSIYLNSSTGTAYRKTDAGSSTNWLNLATGSIAQSSVLGSTRFPFAASCAWTSTSATYADFAANASCSSPVNTGLATTSTKQPWLTVSSIPAPGDVLVYASGTNYAGPSATCYFSITNGTTQSPAQYAAGGSGAAGVSTLIGRFSYSTAQGATTFKVQAQAGSGSCAIDNAGAATPAYELTAVYIPSQAQTVINPALTPAYAGKFWTSPSYNQNIGASVAASSTRTTASDPSLTAYTLAGTAQNDSSTNVQVAATLPAGEYEVEYTGFLRANSTNAGTTTVCAFELYDGTAALASETIGSAAQAAASNQDVTHLRGYFKLSGSTTKTIVLRAAKIQGDTSAGSNCQVNIGSSNTALLSIKPYTQTVPMPVIANSVITSSAGVERVERVAFGGTTVDSSNCTASPCTIWRQSGGVSSITRTSAGIYVLTFSQPFSGPMSCVGSGANGANGLSYMRGAAPTSSTWTLQATNTVSGAPVDAFGDVICQGPK